MHIYKNVRSKKLRYNAVKLSVDSIEVLLADAGQPGSQSLVVPEPRHGPLELRQHHRQMVGDEELQQFVVDVAVIMDSVVSPDEMIFLKSPHNVAERTARSC